MATALDPKQIVSFEELLMSQVVQQEALTRLLVEKGIFTKEELLVTMRVDQEIKRKRREKHIHNETYDTRTLFIAFFLNHQVENPYGYTRFRISVNPNL